MEEENDRSSAALQGLENENSKPLLEDEETRDEGIEENDENRQLSGNDSSDCTVENASSVEIGESKASQSEALAFVQLSESDFQFNESSHLLSEVPVEYSLQPLQSVEELKDQARAVHEEPMKVVTGQSAQVPKQHQIRACDGPPKLELSLISVTQSGSSLLSPSLPKQKTQSVGNENNPCHAEQDKLKSRNPKPLASLPMLKPPSDGYNWRKYGQKQVKSPEGSRSYYRCTFSDCYAKKIDCCDRTNRVIETVYRSHHNHDPPQKLNCSRENKAALPIVPVNGSNDTTHPGRHLGDPIPLTFSKEPLLGNNQIPETKQQESSGSDETTEIHVKDEYIDGPECINRQKRSSAAEFGSLSKPGKKPKFVVHAADDVGISGDGYRWRKYGQKMVKGNPYPRNYYRCTSAGCPVRKHIERAVDNTNAVVITYKGVHDHDMPVPRKRHGTKCAPLFAATSPVSADNLQTNKNKACQSQTQWSGDKVSDLTGEALAMSGEKRSESARTLLSVGFEIKPC